MYRYKQQLASYQEQVVRLERERDSLVIRSEAYDRIETGADGLSPEDGEVGERDTLFFPAIITYWTMLPEK